MIKIKINHYWLTLFVLCAFVAFCRQSIQEICHSNIAANRNLYTFCDSATHIWGHYVAFSTNCGDCMIKLFSLAIILYTMLHAVWTTKIFGITDLDFAQQTWKINNAVKSGHCVFPEISKGIARTSLWPLRFSSREIVFHICYSCVGYVLVYLWINWK